MREQVLAWLANNVLNLSSTIFSVEQTAVELAKHHNLDVEKARAVG